MEIQINYNKLRGFIREHYGTLALYGKAIGLGSSQLNERLQGRQPFTQEEMLLTARKVNQPDEIIPSLFFNDLS